jgi:ASTRA-associated protein 1
VILVCGYENGLAAVFSLGADGAGETTLLHTDQVHSQPILSLDVEPSLQYFITSGADAVVAKHPIPDSVSNLKTDTPVVINTKHSGQQGLRIRDDGKIFATAGWDGRVRVYSAKAMKEVAVLKWHEVGCYTVAFADVEQSRQDGGENGPDRASHGMEVASPETVRSRRIRQSQAAHWLAAGSKDGKVSLWDIY